MAQISSLPPASQDDPDWQRDAASWPNRDASTFWKAGEISWHVQRSGSGPRILLLHGTGAATHSWAGLASALDGAFELIIPDLPGHGFTQTPAWFRPTLPKVGAAVEALLREMSAAPDIIVGHSAGAAVGVELIRRQGVSPKLFVSINGALKPFGGLMQMIAPAAAKAVAFGGIAARMVSRGSASEARVRKLIGNIGSDPARVNAAPYSTLLKRPGHVQGALKMLANWDPGGLMADCARLDVPAIYIAGAADRAVPPEISREAAGRSPLASYFELKALGHLAHEEAPDEVAAVIRDGWDRLKVRQ